MRAAPLIKRLGLSLAALGAALVAAELAVERWFPVGGVVYRLDAELLHDARPDAARIQPMPRARVGPGDAARVLVTTGPEGMRGRGLDRSGERPRVLVMGDSLVMAENVPAGSTFVSQLTRALEEELDLPARSLEGVNAGRSGYGPDQSLLLLERRAREIQPSLVVFVLCAHNDLGDLARNRLFALDGGLIVRRSPGSRRASRSGSGKASARRTGPRSFACSTRSARAAPSRTSSAVIPYRSISPRFASSGMTPSRGGPSIRSSRTSTTSTWRSGWTSAGVRRSRSWRGSRGGCSSPSDHPRSSASSDPRPCTSSSSLRRSTSAGPSGSRSTRRSMPDTTPRRSRRLMWELSAPRGRSASTTSIRHCALSRRTEELFVGGTDIHWNARGQRWAARLVARHMAADPETVTSLRSDPPSSR